MPRAMLLVEGDEALPASVPPKPEKTVTKPETVPSNPNKGAIVMMISRAVRPDCNCEISSRALASVLSAAA